MVTRDPGCTVGRDQIFHVPDANFRKELDGGTADEIRSEYAPWQSGSHLCGVRRPVVPLHFGLVICITNIAFRRLTIDSGSVAHGARAVPSLLIVLLLLKSGEDIVLFSKSIMILLPLKRRDRLLESRPR